MNQYFQPRKVAAILNVSTTTLHKWAKSGKLVPAILTDSGIKFYSREQIEYCLQNGLHRNHKR